MFLNLKNKIKLLGCCSSGYCPQIYLAKSGDIQIIKVEYLKALFSYF
jgi:hypothetical protein